MKERVDAPEVPESQYVVRVTTRSFPLAKAKGYFRPDGIISEKVGCDKSEAATYDILSSKTDIRLGIQNFIKTSEDRTYKHFT